MGRKDIVIAAYYETKYQRRSGRSVYDFAGEVAKGVLDASHLEKKDVDGVAVLTSFSGANEPFWSVRVNEALGLTPRWLQMVDVGGASAVVAVARAAEAIRDKRAEVVLVIGVDAPTTEWNTVYKGYRAEFEEPYGPMGPPGLFALFQRRVMKELKIKDEHLGKIAITQRDHARLNPNALLRDPMTMDDYLKSKMISSPLRLFDSVMFCDGGGAIIVTTEERAASITDRPVYVLGWGEFHNYAGADPAPDVTLTGFRECAYRAFKEAEIRPEDVKTFQPYDDFTVAVALQLAEHMFTTKENLPKYIEETDFSINGDLPLNTGGGQLSVGQPGLAGGMVNLIEGIRQLRGEGEKRQVKNANPTVVTGLGVVTLARNWHSSITMVLGR
ncbi:MAG: thiolase family protein [Nitrososphaeria archaeon]